MAKEKKENAGEQQKLTYEQLEQIAHSLDQRCKALYEELSNARSVIAHFNEVNTLLSIISKGEYFSEEFIKRCCDRIEKSITEALDASEEKPEEKQE